MPEIELKDEDLARLFLSTHDEKYLNQLLVLYKKQISQLAFQYHEYHLYSGISYQDLYLVSLESFYFALSKFKPEEGTTLYGYWKTLARGYLSNYIKENSYDQRARMFRGVLSLDQDFDKDGKDLLLAEAIGVEDEFIANFEDDFLSKYMLLREGGVRFRDIENNIITLLISGLTISEICQELGINEVRFKSIERTIKRKCAINKNTHS